MQIQDHSVHGSPGTGESGILPLAVPALPNPWAGCPKPRHDSDNWDIVAVAWGRGPA